MTHIEHIEEGESESKNEAQPEPEWDFGEGSNDEDSTPESSESESDSESDDSDAELSAALSREQTPRETPVPLRRSAEYDRQRFNSDGLISFKSVKRKGSLTPLAEAIEAAKRKINVTDVRMVRRFTIYY